VGYFHIWIVPGFKRQDSKLEKLNFPF
jgi:hypothetical protein